MSSPITNRAVRIAAALACCAFAAQADNASSTAAGDWSMLQGPDIYQRICQGCHMPTAEGAAGAGHYPKLASDASLVSWQYAAITVLNGRKGMPAFGEGDEVRFETMGVHLTDAQIAEVVNYVRSNFGNHFKEKVTAQQVAALPHPGMRSSH
jgi:mono/diheme cytochrome c family protein